MGRQAVAQTESNPLSQYRTLHSKGQRRRQLTKGRGSRRSASACHTLGQYRTSHSKRADSAVALYAASVPDIACQMRRQVAEALYTTSGSAPDMA
eukprot:48929-Rhodomonas_salina.3